MYSCIWTWPWSYWSKITHFQGQRKVLFCSLYCNSIKSTLLSACFLKDRRRKKWNKIKWTKWICPQRHDFSPPSKLHGTHFCCKSTYGKSNVHFHHDLHSGRADNALSDQQMLCVIDWRFYNWCGTKVSRLPFLKIMCWRFSTEYSAVHLFWMWIKYQMTLNLVLRLTVGFLVTINIRNVCILKECSIVSDILFLITAVTIWSLRELK